MWQRVFLTKTTSSKNWHAPASPAKWPENTNEHDGQPISAERNIENYTRHTKQTHKRIYLKIAENYTSYPIYNQPYTNHGLASIQWQLATAYKLYLRSWVTRSAKKTIHRARGVSRMHRPCALCASLSMLKVLFIGDFVFDFFFATDRRTIEENGKRTTKKRKAKPLARAPYT